MADTELVWKSAVELGALLRAKKVSPVEVVQAHLAWIEAVQPKVNAYLTVTGERALAEARTAESEIAKGKYRGPLHGIPYAAKDLIATKGIRTTNGSRATADWVPEFESAVTERLAQAGAILLGKLNLLEFAMGSGQRGLRGPARNPWDLRYSPSGSSSGSGAALAAGMATLTIGTDSGGSIRGPAKSCGVAGLKPTYDRVSREGVTSLSWTLDHVGPMGRSVADVALLLQGMTGSRVPMRERGLRGMRIGVADRYFFERVKPETETALRKALAVLRELGAEVVEVEVRQANIVGAVSGTILGSESAAYHLQRLKEKADLLDPLVRERLEACTFYSAVDYIQALRIRTVLIEEMARVFRGCDVLMMPAGNAAPLLEEEIVGSDVPPIAPRPDSFNLANVTGIPSLVIPCGFTPGPPVLPLGIQFCAAPNREDALFRVGQAYQGATDWHSRRAPL